MRFTEVVENNRLRGYLSDLIEYTYNWEQFDPYCPKEDIEKIEKLTKEIYPLIGKVENILEELGSINKDCYGY